MVLKRVHLLRNNVRVEADRPGEQPLCDSRIGTRISANPNVPKNLARSLLNAVPQRGLRRKNIAHALNGLKFTLLSHGGYP